MVKPYKDLEIENPHFLREFDQNVDPIELKWHRDARNRRITVLEGRGWKFQYDNRLPFILVKGTTFVVEVDQWHRLIKGDTKLVLDIYEYD